MVIRWQSRFLRAVARPAVRTAALTVSRSNGKSWLAARLAADYLLGGAERSECVIVASSYLQAKVIYRYAVDMVIDAGHDPTERGRWYYRDGANVALLRSRKDGRAIRALGSDPRRMHGRKYGLALIDEPSQHPPGTRDAALAAITSGAGKVPGSKIIALGTRPANGDHWFQRWLDGVADYAQVHAARPGDPVYWLRTIRRANPSFDYLPALREDVLSQRDAARKDEGALASYMALALNLGVSDTSESLLIEASTWRKCESDELPDRTGGYCLSFDLGSGSAMTAAAAYWPASGRLEAVAAFGSVPDLRERGKRDQVGDLYWRLHRTGDLLLLGGRVPDVSEVVRECLRRWGPPSAIVCDRWREAELRDALERAGAPVVPLAVRGMGWRDGSEDVRGFRRAVLSGKVVAPRSLLIRAALAEARTVSDPAGNMKLSKGSQGGRRSRARDDVACAILLAVSEARRRYRPVDPLHSLVSGLKAARKAVERVGGHRAGVRVYGPGATA